MILISVKLFWPKSEKKINNKIVVLCLFNYIILKIVCPEQYIKRLIEKKVNSLATFYSKNEIFSSTQ